MKFDKTIYSVFAIIVILTSGCQKDPEIGSTGVAQLSGDWFVQARFADGNFAFDDSYSHIVTYNTASNSAAEMWFEDGFWGTKFKTPVNVGNLAFGGTTAIKNYDPEYDVDITLKNGKVIKNGAKGPGSKSPTDSIYYEIQYSDDDSTGAVYYISGYRRTGFEEDEH